MRPKVPAEAIAALPPGFGERRSLVRPEIPPPALLPGENERRARDLLEGRLRDQAIDAQRAEADARFEADVWRERALRFLDVIRRTDPVYLGGDSCS